MEPSPDVARERRRIFLELMAQSENGLLLVSRRKVNGYRKRIEELEAALRPFAAADRAIGDEPGPFRFETMRGYREISRDDLRRAREALKEKKRRPVD